jgi:hypothetical protein
MTQLFGLFTIPVLWVVLLLEEAFRAVAEDLVVVVFDATALAVAIDVVSFREPTCGDSTFALAPGVVFFFDLVDRDFGSFL